MKIIHRDIFLAFGKIDAVCITTNGFVKSNGCCVMGRGVALGARQRFRGIDRTLGDSIKRFGNTVQPIMEHSGTTIVSFPVKPVTTIANSTLSNIVSHWRQKFKPGDTVPGFASTALTDLIESSARQLKKLADNRGWTHIALPPAGCSNGQLSWEVVRPILTRHLDDRFWICFFNNQKEASHE